MPETFGRYELIDLLGRGGMGEVYRALDTSRDRVVALKLLPDYLANDESFKARFRRESRMAAKLNEPHIIPIHDFGEIDGRLYLDMRMVEGRDLGSVLESNGALPVEVGVEVIAQIAAALDAAHASGLIHRDVKPSNVLLTGTVDDPTTVPFAYLVDFGIARSAVQEGTALTATTATVGTVAYMSPERIGGLPGDLRTDVYALACMLFETLTGRKPFEGEIFAQMYGHMNTPPPKVTDSRPDCPAALDDVVAKGMAKDPDDRYASAGELARAARTAVRTAAAGSSGSAAVAPIVGTSQQTQQVPLLPPPAAPISGTTGSSAVIPTGWAADPTPPPLSAPPDPTPLPPPSGPAYGSVPSAASATSASYIGGGTGFAAPAYSPPTAPTGRSTSEFPSAPNRPPNANRWWLVAAAAAVIVAVSALIIALHNGGQPDAISTSSVSTSHSSSAPAVNLLPTGAAQPAVSWTHFAAFSKFIGTKDADTAGAFKNGNCKIEAAPASDKQVSAIDEVNCTYAGTPGTVTIVRTSAASYVQNYVHELFDAQGYREVLWTVGGVTAGLAAISPSTGTGISNITSTICGLPDYLIQVAAPDRTTMTAQQLHDQFWNVAPFPDAVPPNCNSTYTGVQSGAQAAAGTTTAKDVGDMSPANVKTLLQRGDSTVQVVQVATTTQSSDVMALNQQGTMSFWNDSNDELTKVGSSTYPYAPASLGAPDATGSGALLTGMTDATFIVQGTFSGDGSGNTVAYTNGSAGWGAIKANADGNLAASGQGVQTDGIGLSNGNAFSDGHLETFDCSSTLPLSQCGGNNRVIKFWGWNGTVFTLVGRAGLAK